MSKNYLRKYMEQINESIAEHESKITGLQGLKVSLSAECDHAETYEHDGVLYCGVCEKPLELPDDAEWEPFD